jgi:hypothetical protein
MAERDASRHASALPRCAYVVARVARGEAVGFLATRGTPITEI